MTSTEWRLSVPPSTLQEVTTKITASLGTLNNTYPPKFWLLLANQITHFIDSPGTATKSINWTSVDISGKAQLTINLNKEERDAILVFHYLMKEEKLIFGR